MFWRKRLSVGIFLFFSVIICASYAHASVTNFDIITNNGNYNDSGDLQISLLLSGGSDYADFTINNLSTVNSSIASVFFDAEGMLLDMVSITNGPGTIFTESAKPKNMPAGSTLVDPFKPSDYSIGADSPAPQDGVNPGEWVTVRFEIAPGTFSSIDDMVASGEMRVGVHIIALPDGSSEAGVTTPEPATLLLLGLGGLVFARRTRKN